jgi:hypothetical protein
MPLEFTDAEPATAAMACRTYAYRESERPKAMGCHMAWASQPPRTSTAFLLRCSQCSGGASALGVVVWLAVAQVGDCVTAGPGARYL